MTSFHNIPQMALTTLASHFRLVALVWVCHTVTFHAVAAPPRTTVPWQQQGSNKAATSASVRRANSSV